MANSKTDRTLILSRLQRLDGLTPTQRTSLAQVLNPTLVNSMSDALLAILVNATLPTLPVNPDQGLPLGLPGAAQYTRFVGATVTGAPLVGDFLVGDFVLSRSDGKFYACTAAGSPGTWVASTGGGSSGGLTSAQVQALIDAALVGN